MKYRPFASMLLLGFTAACGGTNDVVYTADQVAVYDASSLLPETTVVVPAGPVVIERIWSPESTIAELLGTGAVTGDAVTVDDGPAEVLSFDVDDLGSFTVRLHIADAGAHTVCIRDECGRVFVEVGANDDGG